MTTRHQRLDLFDPRTGSTARRGFLTLMAWSLVRSAFFLSSIPWPSSLKRRLLIIFGAQIGKGLYLRPRVNIHYPWNLIVGDHCWIGDRCEILNLESVTLEDHVALAHDVYLAAGGHDTGSQVMRYRNAPIRIRRGAWLCTRSFVGPGVTIGDNAVLGACAVAIKDIPAHAVAVGNPARQVRTRVFDKDLVD